MTSVRAALRRAGSYLLMLPCDPYVTVAGVAVALGLWLMGGEPWEGWE